MHANVTNIERTSWRLPPDETLQVGDSRKDDEELVYEGAEESRNWRGIFLSLLVISLVIAGIVFAIHTLGYVDELLYWSGRRMTLAEFLGGELQPRRLPPTWVAPDHFVFHADDGSLALWSANTGAVTTLVTNHTMRQLDVQGFQVSADRKFVLFRHNMKPVFQNTYTAYFTVYDVINDHHLPIRLSGGGASSQTRLQHAAWLGNTTELLLAHDNDLYVQRAPATTTQPARLTNTGLLGEQYNGVQDWLYQEEGLLDRITDGSACWPSVDGTRLLYVAFNDSGVRELQVPWIGSTTGPTRPGATLTEPFPFLHKVHYPTPGSPNPEVRLWVMDLENLEAPEEWEVLPPSELEGNELYLTSAGWVGEATDHVTATWMNRAQNLSIVTTCHQKRNWTCVQGHVERALESSWVDVQPVPFFSADGSGMLVLSPVQQGGADFFTHIIHSSLTELPRRFAVISHGRHEVERIFGWHADTHLVYYLATHESGPGQRHVYVAADPGIAPGPETRRLEPRCLTCSLREPLFTNCSYFSASLNPSEGKEFLALVCQGPGTPRAAIFESVPDLKGKLKLVRMLYKGYQQRGNPTSTGMAGSSSAVTGGDVSARMASLALPTFRTFEVPLPQNSRARVQLFLPPSWREELRDATFPVLVEVNGRPGSQSVDEVFRLDWGSYMSSHNDVVYVKLDVRGSSGQGRRASRALYRHLGGVEVQDQIIVLRYLLDTLSFLDASRVGLWGWGYGAYVTSMVLGSQQNIFKCGIAISPVTDWFHYNSAFTERVLGLPADNFKGYVEADATQHARHVPNHALFLMHGLADLSTPYNHAVALARALADAGVLFRYHSYADEGHSLEGVTEHVYTSMEDYLRECLNLDSEPSTSS